MTLIPHVDEQAPNLCWFGQLFNDVDSKGRLQAPNVHAGLFNFLVMLIPQGDEQAPNVHVGLVNF